MQSETLKIISVDKYTKCICMKSLAFPLYLHVLDSVGQYNTGMFSMAEAFDIMLTYGPPA